MAVYISNQTGLWSAASTWLTAAAGTFSPTAAAGQPPQSFGFDKIVVRGGHTVTYDVQGCFGDQTSTYGAGVGTTGIGTNTISANAIVLSGGTLKASRTNNIELTACGTIVIAPSGVLDWGTTADPLTANANITLHFMQNLTGLSALSASSNSAGIYMYQGTTNVSYNHHIYICGKSELRNTTLATSAANGATVISVVSATGWEVGDKLIIATEAISAINTVGVGVLSATNIVSMTGNNITISTPLNTSRSAGTCVGNFTSNVNIKSYSGQYPSFGMYMVPSVDSIISINNCRFADIGNGATNSAPYYAIGWVPYNYTGAVSRSSSTGNASGPIAIQFAYNTIPATLKGICIETTNTVASACPASWGLNLFGSFPDYSVVEDIAIHFPAQIGTSQAILFNAQATLSLKNCTVYRALNGMSFGSGSPNNIILDNVNIDAAAAQAPQNYGLQWTMTNSKLRGLNNVVALDGVQNATIRNSIIQCGVATGMFSPNNNASGTVNVINCTITPSTSAALNIATTASTNRMGQSSQFNIYQLNGNVFDNRRFNYFHYSVSDLTVRRRGITTLKIKPNRTNTPFYLYNTLNGIAGVVQRIKGSLRFDSNYGVTYPPSISFVGAGVNTVFTCASTANVWQDFDLSLSATSTDDILMTITSQSSATNGFVWLDGLPFNPFIQDVRHYGFVFDKVADRTIDTLTTLTENQVSALGSISNLDQLYDASNYWSVTNPTLTSYVDLYNANGTVLDFGNKNIVINNTGTALTYISATNTITLDAPTLSAGINFDTLKTSGTVTLSTGLISNIDINAPIVQTIPTNLTGVFMLSGTLSYNTDTLIEVEYTNCTMIGVKNDGNVIVTIKRTNSTVTESDAEITTYAPTLIDLILQDGYIALYDNTGARQYFQNNDGTLILPANATGNWSYKIARYGYQLIAGSFTVNPAVGGTIDIAPSYIPDTFITQSNVSVVSGYTDLNGTDKIHDYLSYYLTTSSGIDYGIIDSESFGVLSFYGNLIMSGSAASVVDYNIGTNTLKIKSSSVNDSITFVVASAFSQDGGNTIGDNLKIRSSNLDSELYFNNVNTIVFYPSLSDRDNNTNAGISLSSASIYRFKYASTINGITFTDYVYSRVTIDGSTLLYVTPITTGSTTIDFGTVGNLQTILNNQRILNIGVQKASKLIPHTTNI